MLPSLAGLVLAAAAAPPPSPPPASERAGTALAGDVDWAVAGEEAARMLSGLLQIDTINPEGHETRAAVFLGAWLAREGIPARIVEFAPGRGSLIARLAAHPDARAAAPICLLSHIDVAEAEADRWPEGRGPLSGALDADGFIWGRGALDMKGLTALQALSMALVARAGLPLDRDLVLLAVADEEVGNQGAAQIAGELWGEIGCSHVLNEGGIGIEDMFFEGQDVYSISVGEKGALWGRIVAEGAPGHGSVPLPDQSIDRLLDAVAAIAERPIAPEFHPAILELLDAVGDQRGGLAGAVLQRPALVRTLLKPTFLGNPVTRAVVLDTANITGLGGYIQPNVIPGEAWASLDARLLPGTDPDAFVAALTDVIDDPHVRVEVDAYVGSNVSEWRGDPLFEALSFRATEGHPERVAGPVLSVGYTDSAVFRPLGVRAYGLLPVLASVDQLATMHGDNERVSLDQLTDGLRILTLALLDVAGAPGAPPPPPAGPLSWPATVWPPPAWTTHTPATPGVPLPARGARLDRPTEAAAPTPAPAAPPPAAPADPWGG